VFLIPIWGGCSDQRSNEVIVCNDGGGSRITRIYVNLVYSETRRRVNDDLYYLSTCINRIQAEKLETSQKPREPKFVSQKGTTAHEVHSISWFTLQLGCGPKPRSATGLSPPKPPVATGLVTTYPRYLLVSWVAALIIPKNESNCKQWNFQKMLVFLLRTSLFSATFLQNI